MKKLGTYLYTRRVQSKSYIACPPSFEKHEMRVEIIDERRNHWRVKYLGFHASGATVGSLHWVRKDKVKLDQPEAVAPSPVRDDIRLPYKD